MYIFINVINKGNSLRTQTCHLGTGVPVPNPISLLIKTTVAYKGRKTAICVGNAWNRWETTRAGHFAELHDKLPLPLPDRSDCREPVLVDYDYLNMAVCCDYIK